MARNAYDWDAIFTDIRAGILSKREVARKHGIDPSYMIRQAKKAGVKQDLSARVKQAVHTKLVHKSVHAPNASDDEIVEAESSKVAGVIEVQRKDIQRHKELSAKLIAELEGQTGGAELIEQARIALGQGDMDGLATAIQKMASLPERIKGASQLSVVLKNLIALERQAFNLDDANPGETDIRKLYNEICGNGKRIPGDG